MTGLALGVLGVGTSKRDAERIAALERQLETAKRALRMIAGQEQCPDNLMSNVHIALRTLESLKRAAPE